MNNNCDYKTGKSPIPMHEVVRYIRVTEELLDNDSGSHFLALGIFGAPAPERFTGARDSITKSFLRFMFLYRQRGAIFRPNIRNLFQPD